MSERRIEKRNRPPVSCEPCRTRKLKCSRGVPCESCVKRGKTDICRYAPNADRSRADGKRAPVADRLKKLEELIATLAEEGGPVLQAQPPSSAQSTPIAKNVTTESPAAVSQTGYTDANHWSSILEDIRDIREQLAPVQEAQDPRDSSSPPTFETPPRSTTSKGDVSGFDFGFGQIGSSTFQDVLAGLPSRQVCDFLVAHYFQARFTTLPIIHPEEFQRQYNTFWEAGDKASPIWTALLFGVLALSAGTTTTRTLGTVTIPPVGDLVRQTRQCLVLGNYTEATEHVLEALLLHLQSFFLKTTDTVAGMWFISGMMLRLALRLGYHRDPSTIRDAPGLTPFKAEMRRRVWTSIFQLDTLVSFQMGLPSMMPLTACDCALPLNLEYSDFGPDTTVLPPGRPRSDHTTVLYTIVKHPTLEAFRSVVAHTQALGKAPYQQTIALDAVVRAAYDSVPEILRTKPISRSLVDGSSVIMRRITIEMLSQKALIVLHRRHLQHDTDVEACASHQACLHAALQMLVRQVEMTEASQPGGMLYDDRWMISTVTANDIILASVVVCLDLTIRTRARPCACDAGPAPVTLEEELAAIEGAHKIWEAAGAYSAEARVAARALEGTIRRVGEYQKQQASALSYNYEDHMERISFRDDTGVGGMDVTYEENSPNAYHWEFIDNWLLSNDEEMPDLGVWILEGA
ncbi:fungal-specific transcription factor domain-containing protein [Plectosphaerella plurivora]|uniref:Fungal-specific transcription factor domain-containing protein n=1 Tax=Plectosphaerella plurivora TaxID=936078 RepID=A0A9P9AG96_9PEZI|nr:fungal-specific transcription factor domain-containing protein [Plectosphaerella plurivora]